MSTDHAYRYCGLVLKSNFPIPELPKLTELPDGTSSAEVTACREVTSLTADETMNPISPILGIAEQSVTWQLPGVAHFRVSRAENLIEVEPAASADWDSIRLFLLHPVFVLSRLLHGDFMLRAAAVAVNGQAIALVGPTACGKSTLAAALHQRGHPLLSDGLLRIAKNEKGIPVAYPQAPWLLLWPDALKRVGLNKKDTCSVRPQLGLSRWPTTTASESPMPLTRILLMREQRGNDQDLFESEVRAGFNSIHLLRNFTAGEGWLHVLGLIPQHFQWSIEMTQACQRERLDLPWGWERFEDCVSQVENWCN